MSPRPPFRAALLAGAALSLGLFAAFFAWRAELGLLPWAGAAVAALLLASHARGLAEAHGALLRRHLGEEGGGETEQALAGIETPGRLLWAARTQLGRERVEHRERVAAIVERAHHAPRYRKAFLAAASHELRTPLNAIFGFTEILLAELEGPLSARQREWLEELRAEGNEVQGRIEAALLRSKEAAEALARKPSLAPSLEAEALPTGRPRATPSWLALWSALPALALAALALGRGLASGTLPSSELSVILPLLAVAASAGAGLTHALVSRTGKELSLLAEHLEEAMLAARQGRAAPPAPPLRSAFGRALLELDAPRLEELRELREALAKAGGRIQAAEVMRSTFMRSIGRRVPEPLYALIDRAHMLEESELGPEQRESLVLVRRASEELARLVEDIRSSMELEAETLVAAPSRVPAEELLEQVRREGGEAVEGGFALEAEGASLPAVFVDRALIVRATLCLLRHAARAARKSKSTVVLKAAPEIGPPGPTRQLRVQVLDPGGELPEEGSERLFEAYSEIRPPPEKRAGGLGTALYVARGLARLQGGEAWCEGRPEGLCYFLALPLAPDPADDPPPSSEASPGALGRATSRASGGSPL